MKSPCVKICSVDRVFFWYRVKSITLGQVLLGFEVCVSVDDIIDDCPVVWWGRSVGNQKGTPHIREVVGGDIRPGKRRFTGTAQKVIKRRIKKSARRMSVWKFGSRLPASQLPTVDCATPKASAKDCWDLYPADSRSSRILTLNIQSPCVKGCSVERVFFLIPS